MRSLAAQGQPTHSSPFALALAAGLAVVVAELMSLPFPIYAMISAVLVTDLAPALIAQARRAAHRRRPCWERCWAPSINYRAAGEPVVGRARDHGGAMLLSNLLGLRQAAKVAGLHLRRRPARPSATSPGPTRSRAWSKRSLASARPCWSACAQASSARPRAVTSACGGRRVSTPSPVCGTASPAPTPGRSAGR